MFCLWERKYLANGVVHFMDSFFFFFFLIVRMFASAKNPFREREDIPKYL